MIYLNSQPVNYNKKLKMIPAQIVKKYPPNYRGCNFNLDIKKLFKHKNNPAYPHKYNMCWVSKH